jgi:IS4 transposase
LLTTNKHLDFAKAFEIYATRWTIEVFFKECKQYLRLGKCESRDFDAQIAATTLCMLQYNLFSVVKRFECYESFGALFRQATSETLELTIKERIYLIIKEITTTLANYFDFDPDSLLKHIIADNEQLTNLLNLNSLANAA